MTLDPLAPFCPARLPFTLVADVAEAVPVADAVPRGVVFGRHAAARPTPTTIPRFVRTGRPVYATIVGTADAAAPEAGPF